MKQSHTDKLITGAVLAVVISFVALLIVTRFLYISEPICAAILVIAVVTTECVLLRGYAEEDKRTILEEIQKQNKQ